MQVTTLLARLEKSEASGSADTPAAAELAAAVAKQGAAVKAAKALAKQTGSDDDAAAAQGELSKLLQLKEALTRAEAAEAAGALPMSPSGKVDYTHDFFGRRAYLTVSGQLNGETLGNAWPLSHLHCATAIAQLIQDERQQVRSLQCPSKMCSSMLEAQASPGIPHRHVRAPKLVSLVRTREWHILPACRRDVRISAR